MKPILLPFLPVVAVTAGLASAQCDGLDEDFEGQVVGSQIHSSPEWISSHPTRATVEVGSGSNTSQVLLIDTNNGGVSVTRTVPSNVSTYIDLSLDLKISGPGAFGEFRMVCSGGLPQGVVGGIRFDTTNGVVRSFKNFSTTRPLNPDFAPITVTGEPGGTLTINYDGQPLDAYAWPANCSEVINFEFQAQSFMGTNTDLEIDNLCMSTPTIGSVYCDSNPNSTGVVTDISATGSTLISANDLTVTMSSMPLNQFGYFITSQTQGFVANPGGSLGNLCVLGSIGRYNALSQIGFSGSTGTISLALDLTSMPRASGDPVPAFPGQTWNLQGWHRDAFGQNNFSNALAIMLL